LPQLQSDIWEAYREKGVQVLGVNYKESAATVQNTIDTYGLTFPNLLDTYGTIYWLYGDGYIPYNVVLDQDFTVVYTAHGFYESTIISHIEANLPDVFANLYPDYYSYPKGSEGTFELILTNDTGSPIFCDVWLEVIRPGHNEYINNPVGMGTVRLAGDTSYSRDLSIEIPSTAPADDQYWLRVQVGSYPDDVWTSDIVNFEITE
jgi:hypothetical protein